MTYPLAEEEKKGHFLDLENWPRRQHYEFFKSFADPYYNMCAEVDVTDAVALAKSQGLSFFHLTLFLCFKAVNQVEAFRYRIRDGKVWVYDQIHPSCTVLNQDKTFSFCEFVYHPDFGVFDEMATEAKQHSYHPPSQVGANHERDNVIHCSVIPWVNFTNFTHPKMGLPDLSIPKFGFGKYTPREGRLKMSVSVDVNHMFVDGYHIGQFFMLFQDLLDNSRMALCE